MGGGDGRWWVTRDGRWRRGLLFLGRRGDFRKDKHALENSTLGYLGAPLE